MNIRKSLYLVAVLGILISGCATTQSIPSSSRTRVFKTDYDQTFKAVVQTLSINGYAISSADSKEGIITTDYTNASSWQAIFTGNRRTKINAVINKTDDGTQVMLNISVQEREGERGWESVSMTKGQARDYYRKIFGKIADNLAIKN